MSWRGRSTVRGGDRETQVGTPQGPGHHPPKHSRWQGADPAPRGKPHPGPAPTPGPPSYTVHRLLLTVQAQRCLDEAADGVDGEVLPVTIARGLQEAVAHGPIEALVLVCGINLVHVGAQGDLLWGVGAWEGGSWGI